MEKFLNPALDVVLKGLNFIYGESWVAPFLILPVMLAIAAYLHVKAARSTKPYLTAVANRIDALKSAIGTDPDPIAERDSFSQNYSDVAAALNDNAPGAESLVLAWREFHESIIDESANPVRNTVRPTVFFHRVAPNFKTLTFASNVFVGVGLILTFLGLIVALHTTAEGMKNGDVQAAQLSLVGLLTVAGAKFFTSVAGLLASIWLRFAEHGLSGKVRRSTDLICALLERGLLYVPPQRLAVEQLEVMKEQRDQLKFFNTDVALQLSERIGVQFQQAIAPMADSLTQLNDNMTSVTQGIGAGAREAIEKVSGDQLRGLSETLAGLSHRMEALGQAVGASSNDAASQIRLAGADFAKAATDIRDAFDSLAGRVDGMGEKLTEQSDQVARAQNDAVQKMLADMEETQAQSAQVIASAVEALKTAGSEAAVSLQSTVSEALSAGVEESQRTFRAAVEESGASLRETSSELSRAVGDAAERVERAASEFVRSGQSAERTAEAMGDVSDRARTVATSLSDAAGGFATAAAPVAQAAQLVSDAASKIATTVEADRTAGSAALTEMKELADGVKAVHESAEDAWRDYKARFENVDRALAQTVDKMTQTLSDSLTEFRRFAQETDRELAAAVGRLANTTTQIEEYAEALDDYVQLTRTPTLEAAE